MVENFKQHLENKIFNIISQAAKELNLESYVIGGFVRDILLERNHKKDIDQEINFAPEFLRKIL